MRTNVKEKRARRGERRRRRPDPTTMRDGFKMVGALFFLVDIFIPYIHFLQRFRLFGSFFSSQKLFDMNSLFAFYLTNFAENFSTIAVITHMYLTNKFTDNILDKSYAIDSIFFCYFCTSTPRLSSSLGRDFLREITHRTTSTRPRERESERRKLVRSEKDFFNTRFLFCAISLVRSFNFLLSILSTFHVDALVHVLFSKIAIFSHLCIQKKDVTQKKNNSNSRGKHVTRLIASSFTTELKNVGQLSRRRSWDGRAKKKEVVREARKNISRMWMYLRPEKCSNVKSSEVSWWCVEKEIDRICTAVDLDTTEWRNERRKKNWENPTFHKNQERRAGPGPTDGDLNSTFFYSSSCARENNERRANGERARGRDEEKSQRKM